MKTKPLRAAQLAMLLAFVLTTAAVIVPRPRPARPLVAAAYRPSRVVASLGDASSGHGVTGLHEAAQNPPSVVGQRIARPSGHNQPLAEDATDSPQFPPTNQVSFGPHQTDAAPALPRRTGQEPNEAPLDEPSAPPRIASSDPDRPVVLPLPPPKHPPAMRVELEPRIETDHGLAERAASEPINFPSAKVEDLPPPGRGVVFRTVPLATPSESSADVSGLELRLAGLQRQVEQLSRLQDNRHESELQRLTHLVRQVEQTAQIQALERQIEQLRQLQSAPLPAAPATIPYPAVPPAAPPTPPVDPTPAGPVLKARPNDGAPERFTLQIQDADLTQVLEMLGQMSGENILIGRDVRGRVSANLQDVGLEQALSAILRSQGFVYQREDGFVFVMSPAEAEARRSLGRKLVTKVYRPNYISVKDLQALITPLLTEGVSKIAVTNPSESGIARNAENAGGDQLAQRDALLVQDYAEVLDEVDAVVLEMDVPPMQVVIEAMILSVKLNDSMAFGVNFALLHGPHNRQLLVSGAGHALAGATGFPGAEGLVPPGAEFIARTAGLKYGFLHGDVAGFIYALESLSDTSLVAAPQLRVLNKQRAELLIGDRLSYRTLAFNGPQAAENVDFLESGTRLLLRPFIAPDGMIRMEIHPERSTAVLDPASGLPHQSTTEVTTNIMVRDGTTAVIGGLIEEQTVEIQQRVPVLGAIPLVGNAFRNRTEQIERTELIVLITPRIVIEPDTALLDEALRFEGQQRAEHFRDHLTPFNRRNLARSEFERALRFYERGELVRARHHVKQALRHNRHFTDALRLQQSIEAALQERNRTWWKQLVPGRAKGAPVEPAWPHDAAVGPALEPYHFEGPAEPEFLAPPPSVR